MNLRSWCCVLIVAIAGPPCAEAQPYSTSVTPPTLSPNPTPSPEFSRLLSLAQSGDLSAEMGVAHAYFYGQGVPKNLPESYAWSLKAANGGNAQAEKAVAWFHEKGVVVPVDDGTALLWWQKAAQDGDAECQVEMGWRYQTGRGVREDLAESAKWYQKAAIQGSDQGEAALGCALLTGQGVPRDLQNGFAYLLSAADKNAYARSSVALCYARGIYVARDPIEAYRWCLLSMELDGEAAGLMASLKSGLSPAQITQAAKEAADFHRQQKEHDLQTSDLSIVFTGNSAVTIPFEYVLSKILIPVQIDDAATKYFMIDTGSDATFLNSNTAGDLKITGNQFKAMGGIGPDIVLSRLATPIKLSLPGLDISGATVGLLPFDWDQYLGHPLAGILGYDILRHLVMTIDYVQKKITFRKPGTFAPDAASERIPLLGLKTCPVLEGALKSKAGLSKAWFLADTGAGECTILTKVFQEANPQLQIEQPVQTGASGIGGIDYATNGKLPRLILGKIEIANPIATLESRKQGKWQDLMGGYIGDGILHRFDATFDGPDGILYLRPNAQFADPFTFINVGMGLKTAKADYHAVSIFAIVPHSPAERAHFQVGDRIVRIDKAVAATSTLSDLYDALKKMGRHRLEIIRSGKSETIDLNVDQEIR